MKKWITGVIAVVCIAVAVLFGYRHYFGNEPVETMARMVTAKVEKGDIQARVSGTGSIQPGEREEVYSPEVGTVKEVLVEEGDKVAAGDVLVTFEAPDLSDQIEQTEYSLRQQQINMENLQRELKEQTDEAGKERVINEILSLELQIRQNEEKLFSYQEEQNDIPEPVVSPIDGEIVSLNVSVGEEINSGSFLVAEVVDYDRMHIEIQVDELDIPKVKIGQIGEIEVEALPDRKFTGKVIEIAREGEISSGVAYFDVTLLVDDPAGLRAGMSAEARILVEDKQDVLILPIEAVQLEGEQSFVMTEGGTRKEIQVGTYNENSIEIVSGLAEGDAVIIPPQAAGTSTDMQEMRRGPGGAVRIGGPGDGPGVFRR